MSKVILLVEDNEHILADNRWWLERQGYRVVTSGNLSQAREALRRNRPDGIILDIMLPDGSGLDFLRELRTRSDVPVLLLTGLSTNEDVVRGLAAGGDDYLPKPYDYEVFLARVGALLRRGERIPDLFERGPLTFNILSSQVFLEGKDMLLTQKQFAILLMLARREGETFSARHLYESVWRQPMGEDGKAIKTLISRLRGKLAGSGFSIVSLRGEGYRFEKVD